MNPSRRYLLISPCRDEAQFLRRTLDSVAAQSVLPALWVVVDDGSTDDTETAVGALCVHFPVPVCYLRQRQAGPAATGVSAPPAQTVLPGQCGRRALTMATGPKR